MSVVAIEFVSIKEISKLFQARIADGKKTELVYKSEFDYGMT